MFTKRTFCCIAVTSGLVLLFLLWEHNRGNCNEVNSRGVKKHSRKVKKEAEEHLASIIALRPQLNLPVKFTVNLAEELAPSTSKTRRRKLIYFVRHGQGVHNLAAEESVYPCDCQEANPTGRCPYLSKELIDSELTPRGQVEAGRLSSHTRDELKDPDIVYVSPLRRATETALLAFPHLAPDTGNAPRWVADEDLREQSGQHICDRRLSAKDLGQQFPGVDYSGITNGDQMWTEQREARIEVAKRGFRFILAVMRRPENIVAVVSHSSFLLTIFNAVLECEDSRLGEWFSTGELRSVCVSCENVELETVPTDDAEKILPSYYAKL